MDKNSLCLTPFFSCSVEHEKCFITSGPVPEMWKQDCATLKPMLTAIMPTQNHYDSPHKPSHQQNGKEGTSKVANCVYISYCEQATSVTHLSIRKIKVKHLNIIHDTAYY